MEVYILLWLELCPLPYPKLKEGDLIWKQGHCKCH